MSLTNDFLRYDDVQSAKKKAEFVKQLDLGGIAIWSIKSISYLIFEIILNFIFKSGPSI